MNIAQRFHRIGDFFHLATGWVNPALAWLEWRRIYWTILSAPCSARPALRWQPLQLPSQHHPARPRLFRFPLSIFHLLAALLLALLVA